VLPDLRRTEAGYVWAGRDYPAARVSLRSTGPEAFTVVDGTSGDVLGIVEQERAYTTVHQGAIYLHLGESYRVRELDLTSRHAVVEPFRGDYYTQAKVETTTAIVEPRRVEQSARRPARLRRSRGHRPGRRLPEEVDPDAGEPRARRARPAETEFETEAVWFLPEPWMLDGIEREPRLLGSLHAAGGTR
jgi:DEAD/DEAH box helicase domain-containing protein